MLDTHSERFSIACCKLTCYEAKTSNSECCCSDQDFQFYETISGAIKLNVDVLLSILDVVSCRAAHQ